MLGPSTAMESPPAPAPLVEMVKRAGSPVTPATNPDPYAVTYPDAMESTWNLNGEPERESCTACALVFHEISNLINVTTEKEKKHT